MGCSGSSSSKGADSSNTRGLKTQDAGKKKQARQAGSSGSGGGGTTSDQSKHPEAGKKAAPEAPDQNEEVLDERSPSPGLMIGPDVDAIHVDVDSPTPSLSAPSASPSSRTSPSVAKMSSLKGSRQKRQQEEGKNDPAPRIKSRVSWSEDMHEEFAIEMQTARD
mmetsp:Transcript_55290/g.131864  ORF Transcript_55290/g.131864 Transcript_55290/m.131864 type:complete len:164 (+) Transcript_55290:71-562(+)